MATADEILSQLVTEEYKVLVINNDLRTITIPMSVKMLGVESDEDVLRLRFRMPRMCGDTDLSGFVIRINYVNANGIGDIYYVDDTFVDEDAITFSWLIGRNATMYKGDVHFVVCLKLYDDAGELTKEYNTTISSLPVLEGLEVSDVINTQNPDIIEKILLRLNKLEESDPGTGGATAWNEITDKPFNTIDGNTLVNRSGALCVNTTDDAEQDNTRPITSSGVHVICGNINALLQAI